MSEHDFTSEEKRWLCQSFTDQLNSLGKSALTLTAVSSQYKIPRSTFSGWMGIFRAGGMFMESGGQRSLDKDACQTVLDKVENNLKDSKKDMNESKFIATVKEEVSSF